jgi:hypothetical protein
MLTRYNRKTVTVVTDGGRRWNVAPRLLRRAGESGGAEERPGSVIDLRRPQ